MQSCKCDNTSHKYKSSKKEKKEREEPEDMITTAICLLSELGPTEDCEAEFGGRRIEGIDCSPEVEYRRIFQITSEFHHVIGILFKDAIVSVSLAAVRLNSNHQVPQTFASGELTEHKDFELIPARKDLYVTVTLILSNDTIENRSPLKRPLTI